MQSTLFPNLLLAYRQVLAAFKAANMFVNVKKTVVACTGGHAKTKLLKIWNKGRIPPILPPRTWEYILSEGYDSCEVPWPIKARIMWGFMVLKLE
eukprot:3664086-Amphidinium_carterae.1